MSLPSISSKSVKVSNISMVNPFSYETDSNVKSILEMIEEKKAKLRKKVENEQNDSDITASDNEAEYGSTNSVMKYNILSLKNYQRNQKSNDNHKLKTVVENLMDSRASHKKEKIFEKPVIGKRHYRIRTQTNESAIVKSKENQFFRQKKQFESMPRVIKSKLHSERVSIPHLSPQQLTSEFQKLAKSIPPKIMDRNEESLGDVVDFLKSYNPFFMKIDRIVATCLIKVCKIVKKTPKQLIQDREVQSDHFYIILTGKVKISNRQINLRKTCLAGETVLQEILVAQIEKRTKAVSFERVRSIPKSYLLLVELQKFKRVKEELMKFGFKTQYTELEALVKRNYIVKNSLRTEKNKF